MVSVGLWITGLLALGFAAYLASTSTLGAALAVLGGTVVSGLVLCGLAAILDTLVEIRAALEGQRVSTTSRFDADPTGRGDLDRTT